MATSTIFINRSGDGVELENSNGIRLCYSLAEDLARGIIGVQFPTSTEQWTMCIINTGIKYCSNPIKFALRLYQYDAVLVQAQYFYWLISIIKEGIETNLFATQHWQPVLNFLQESNADVLIFNDVKYTSTAKAWEGWESEGKPELTLETWISNLCLEGEDALSLIRRSNA